MSLSTEVELSCDGIPQWGCSTNPIFAHNGQRARAEAREDGWLVSQPGGKDYCPEHRHLAKGGAR